MRSFTWPLLIVLVMLLGGCHGSSAAEASVSCDASQLSPLLKAVQELIVKGFSETEVSQVANAFRSMAVGETKEFKFPVVFRDREATLRIQLKKDDVDAVEIWFFTEPELAAAIQKAIVSVVKDA